MSNGSVVLPFVTRALPPAMPRPAPDQETQLTILVIDSSPEDRTRVRGALTASGFVLIEAIDARSGIQIVASQTIDCILLDEVLPDLDHLEVIERLRRPDGLLPCAVVVLTGGDDRTIAFSAIAAGVRDPLVKQRLDADALKHVIRRNVRDHRRLAEHQLAQAHNAHLASIIAASGDGIVSTRPDGDHIRSWSPGATHIFGYTENEAVGRTIDELIIPDHLKDERARLFAAVGSGRQAVLVETMRRHKSGLLVPVEINAAQIVGADGTVTGYSVIFRDITERRKTEARLASIRDALSSDSDRGRPHEVLAETRGPMPPASSTPAQLVAVHAAELLDAPADGAFDQITRLVSTILQAPVSLLTVVDSERQFFVSSYGLTEPLHSARRSPLSRSYCRHVIDSGAPLVVHDAECNPVVSAIGAWRDGFVGYLGVPIRDRNGVVVASLCAVDSKVRAWTHQELLSLEGLARLLMRELENRTIRRELEDNERFSRSVLESSPDCVKVIDRDGRLQFMNRNGMCLMEIDDVENVVGRSWTALWPAETRAVVAQAVADGLQGKPSRFEAVGSTAKGRPRWWDVIVEPTQSPTNSTGQLISVSRDITERKRIEDALRASDEHLRATFENAAVGVAQVGPDGAWLQVNARLCEIVGYSREELLALTFQDITVAEDLDNDLAHVDRMLAGEIDSYEIEKRYRRRDGEVVWVNLSVGCVRADDRQVKYFISVVQDITARKAAEVAVHLSEERFRRYVTLAHEGIWAFDGEARTTFVNPRLAALFGTTPEAMTGRPLADFCFAEDLGEVAEYINATLAGRNQEFEGRFRRTDGSALHLLGATSPLEGPDGSVTGALGGFLDLAERKRAEVRQQTMMRELSHRGKNLLAVVQSIANRSMTNDRSLADARDVFAGRLQALANSYSTLTDEAFEGAPLDEIIGTELKPFTGRTRADGPRIMANAQVAQSMALVVHELATNAVKYGALSVPSGLLAVSWRVEGGDSDRRFVFEWQETGGPPARPPTRRGFGTTLISSVAGAELNCTPELVYDEAGFRYRIDAPLGKIGSIVEESPVRQRLQSDEMRALYDAWAGLKRGDGKTPLFKRFDPTKFAALGRLSIAEMQDGIDDIRFIEVGSDLRQRLQPVVGPAPIGSETPANQKASYLRCARANAPSYEHARFKFGEGDIVRFERLLVPFSLNGDRVSHVVGLIVFTGNTTD